jgi:hypothetical protein
MKRNLIGTSPEAGVIYVGVALFLIAALGIAGLAIDIGRIRVTKSQLQNFADNASQASNSYLNGTVKGWRASKRAALAALLSTDVLGLNDEEKLRVVLDRGSLDPLEVSENLRRTEGHIGDFVVKVERGIVLNDGSKEYFEPLEGEGMTPTNVGEDTYYQYYGMPNFMAASAVRVQVEYKVHNYLSPLIKAVKYFDLGAEAISRSYRDSSACVFPAAIPACALGKGEAQSLEELSMVEGISLCDKELLFTDSALWSDNILYAMRHQGMKRYESYMLPPDNELDGGKRVLYGALGSSSSKTVSNPERAFREAVKNAAQGECLTANLGDRFFPVEDATSARKALSKDSVKSLSKDLSAYIRSAPQSFREVFGDPESINSSEGNQRKARSSASPNYPWIPYDYRDRRMFWYDTSGKIGQALMGQQKSKADYTNPMCHYYGENNDLKNLSSESIDGSIPVNSPTAPVQEAYIMVVAPSADGYDYCGHSTSASPISLQSAPIVVGFVKSYIFDFNFSEYPDKDSYTLNELDKNPKSYVIGKPVDSGGEDEIREFLIQASAYTQTYGSWKECKEKCEQEHSCGCGAMPEYLGPESLSQDTDSLHSAFESSTIGCNGTYRRSSESVYEFVTDKASFDGKIIAYRNEQEATQFFHDAAVWRSELIDKWIQKYGPNFVNNFNVESHTSNSLFGSCLLHNQNIFPGLKGGSVNPYAGMSCKGIEKEFWKNAVKREPSLADVPYPSCSTSIVTPAHEVTTYTCDADANCTYQTKLVPESVRKGCASWVWDSIRPPRLRALATRLDPLMYEAIHYCLATAPKSAEIMYADPNGTGWVNHHMGGNTIIQLKTSKMACSDVVAPVLGASEEEEAKIASGSMTDGQLVYSKGLLVESWSEASETENHHCLPEPVSLLSCFDGKCLSRLVPHQPGKGCGGVRSRLSCGISNPVNPSTSDRVRVGLVK